jgi:hypothetical protein
MRFVFAASALAVSLSATSVFAAAPSGAIYTTNKTATVVNGNVKYATPTDVYVSGGPQNAKAAGLPDGVYYFQVTDPSGSKLLSTDNAVCRQLTVSGGRVVGSTGPACKHPSGTANTANGVTPVQLAPFSPTPNQGNEYKAWLVPAAKAQISTSDPKVLTFAQSDSKTDNYKLLPANPVPQGSCQPSSSLSAMVIGANVTSYVPKGNWGVTPTPGVSVVNIEGASVTPALIPTGSDVINSCASNPVTGDTVCTANNNKVYLLNGTTVKSGSPLTSSATGAISFSGGSCTNCGVSMDAIHNKAVISMSLGGVGGFQFLDLSTSAFEPAFASMAPGWTSITENPVIDPLNNRLLNANESNYYEVIDIANTLTPLFYENPTGSTGDLDSSGADCKTGIILAPAEFTSSLFIADLSAPYSTFTPGTPGSWTAPSQNQILSEMSLSAGASGVAVAQGTQTGIVSGEFGGDAITAITLPTVTGAGATPAIGDWVTCSIGSGFVNGYDPHTLTAYQSPGTGNAMALLSNSGATTVAVVDLTKMLDQTIVPRTSGSGLGHACSAGTLPASVVSFVVVP